MNRATGLVVAAALFLGGCSDGGEDESERDDTLDTGAATLPRLADIGLYADTAPVNAPLPTNPELDPDSDRYIAKIAEIAQDPQSPPVLAYGQYSTTVFIAAADTPRTDVTLTCGGDDAWQIGVTTLSDVPIPAHAIPAQDSDGADNPIPPTGCGDQADQDNHLVILDLAQGCEYDLWQARRENGRWLASWANAIPLDSDGIYPTGLSTRGSGFAFLGGVVWPEELINGRIDHALVMSYPLTRSGGPVAPATESDGWSDDPAALPEGAWLRLDPALDLDTLALTPVERTLARAMQTYGIYLVDDGGGIQLYAIDPDSVQGNPYAGILNSDEDYEIIDGIPWERLQVLRLPPQDPDFRQRLVVADNGCAHFR